MLCCSSGGSHTFLAALALAMVLIRLAPPLMLPGTDQEERGVTQRHRQRSAAWLCLVVQCKCFCISLRLFSSIMLANAPVSIIILSGTLLIFTVTIGDFGVPKT